MATTNKELIEHRSRLSKEFNKSEHISELEFLIEKSFFDHKKSVQMAGDLGEAFGEAFGNSQKQKTIYARAIETWGEDSQIIMAIEECGELVQALAKFLNKRTAGSIESVCEETADVIVMTNQLKLLFDEQKINQYISSKLNRLNKRLDDKSFE